MFLLIEDIFPINIFFGFNFDLDDGHVMCLYLLCLESVGYLLLIELSVLTMFCETCFLTVTPQRGTLCLQVLLLRSTITSPFPSPLLPHPALTLTERPTFNIFLGDFISHLQ